MIIGAVEAAMYKLRIAVLFFRESAGIFLIYLGFSIYLTIIEGGWLNILTPLIFLKTIEYAGLVFYYRLLRPHKLIFYMNLGQNIPRLWLGVIALDALITFPSLILLSP